LVLVLGRLGHVASRIVDANHHSIMRASLGLSCKSWPRLHRAMAYSIRPAMLYQAISGKGLRPVADQISTRVNDAEHDAQTNCRSDATTSEAARVNHCEHEDHNDFA